MNRISGKLLSQFPKIFETIFFPKLLSIIEEKTLSDQQFGS